MKQDLALRGLAIGSAIALVANQPAWAAPAQLTGVQLNPTDTGLELVLETRGGTRPQVFTVERGNTFVADIINTQLRLPNGNSFRQDNPAPGITSVMVMPLDANSLRLVVTGTDRAPAGEIVQTNNNGITLSVRTPGGSSTATMPPPPPSNTPPNLSSSPLPSAQNPDVLIPNPDVTIDGVPVPAPTVVQAPPTLPRAIAPPVGDIAVSNTDASSSVIDLGSASIGTADLGSAQIIPRLVLRDAPVREVLALLARAAGLNLAFTSESAAGAGAGAVPGGTTVAGTGDLTISLDIENESVQDIFNYVLRLSGLQANRQGNTIFVGSNLPNAAQDIVIRTFRLNQVQARQAAGFLASMGAISAVTSTKDVTTVQAIPIQGTDQAITQTSTSTQTTIDTLSFNPTTAPGAGRIQPILDGVQALVDERTNSLTLVGPRRLVDIAGTQLVQLDLRRRQVAINVKVIDVNLLNTDDFNSSFSFGINDSFFVNDGGVAVANFGGFNPPSANTVTNSLVSPAIINNPIEGEPFFDREEIINVPLTAPEPGGRVLRPVPPFGEGGRNDPLTPGLSEYEPFEVDTEGNVDAGEATFSLPTLFQYPRRFLARLRAQILNRNAKILTDPTLVVQEGQTASVNLTQDVIGNITTETQFGTGTANTTVTAEIRQAGLQLGVNVERIDDNGFVTLSLTPRITSISGTAELGNNDITLLNERSLNSGTVRLRDGQTLILSGIIQEQERVTASKIPILGDLPLIGALFRNTSRNNERAEVIILVTPQVLDDSFGATYGYTYAPGQDVQEVLQRGNLR